MTAQTTHPVQHRRKRLFVRGAGAVASGLMSAVAFPGVLEYSLLAFVGLIPLYWALYRSSPLHSLMLGWIAGSSFLWVGAWWLPASVVHLVDIPLWQGVILHLGVAMVQGMQWGIAALMYCRAVHHGLPGWLSFATAFAASEAIFPQVLPGTMAVQIHRILELLQIADVVGAAGVTWLLACVNASLGEFALVLTDPVKSSSRLLILRKSLPGVTIVVTAIGYSAVVVPIMDARQQNAPVARIGIVQGGMTGMEKTAHPERVIERHVELSRELLQTETVDFLVWGESAIPVAHGEELLRNNLRKRFRNAIDRPVILGLPIRADAENDQRNYNAAIIAQPDGWICPRCRYNKQKLFPIGEYLPRYLWFMAISDEIETLAGNTASPLIFAERAISTSICYEIIDAALIRRMTTSDTELLLNLAYDGWFLEYGEPQLHLALARLRAIEHRRYLVRVATSGISAVIDPVGRMPVYIDVNEQDARVATISWLTGQTAYARFGYLIWPVVLLIFLLLEMIALLKWFGETPKSPIEGEMNR